MPFAHIFVDCGLIFACSSDCGQLPDILSGPARYYGRLEVEYTSPSPIAAELPSQIALLLGHCRISGEQSLHLISRTRLNTDHIAVDTEGKYEPHARVNHGAVSTLLSLVRYQCDDRDN